MDYVNSMNGLNSKLRKMPKPNEFLLKHLMDVAPKSTSHGVGVKRVMATSNEVGTPITQIAHTLLRKGEVVEEHFHPTMDEHFFFLVSVMLTIMEIVFFVRKGTISMSLQKNLIN